MITKGLIIFRNILLCTYFKRLKFEERRCTKISFTLMCKQKIWPFFQRPCSPWSPLALTKTPKKPDAMVQYESWIIFGSKSILYFASRFGDSGKVLSFFAAECFFCSWTRTLDHLICNHFSWTRFLEPDF